MTAVAKVETLRFPHRHLLTVEGLGAQEINFLLDLADHAADANRETGKKRDVLRGRTLINLFFEASTRTQSSFEMAAKRLGADVMNMNVSTSSVNKGETLIDTAMTLNAMRPDIIVVRHHAAGAVELLSQKIDCSVVNAGDGAHQHPTQALLDALTIRRAKGRVSGLTVAICGDILHSRVARSNIIVLNTLGARVRIAAPSTLLPASPERLGAEVFTDMWKALDGADVVMMLRLQRERMEGSYVPSTREYFHFFGLDQEKLARAKPDAVVMHPGPMNRGVEIASTIADDTRSRHPRAGGDGRRGAHGRARGARQEPAQAMNATMTAKKAREAAKQTAATAFINARLVDPASNRDEPGGLVVTDGRISDIGPHLRRNAPDGVDVIDCKGHVLAPGLIDAQVFTGEPGFEHRETLKTASHAAAAGGVTTIVVMPETNPVIDQVALVDFIQRRARDNAIVNVHTMAAMTKGLKGEEMTEIGLLKRAGAIAFTNGKSSIANTRVMRNVLLYSKDFGALICHHTEDPYLSANGMMNSGEVAARLGLSGVPKAAETIMLERDVRLVEMTGGRYHAATISCAESLDVIRDAKSAQASRHLRRHHQSPDAERERHRPLPHLLQDASAVALRRGPRRHDQGRGVRRHRRDRLEPRSAGRRRQAPALRRGDRRRGGARDAAAGRIAARPLERPDVIVAAARHDHQPREASGAALGPARQRRGCRPRPVRPGRAVGGE